MLRLLMPQALTVAVDVIAWGVFHAGTGYAAHRLGDDRLARDGWLLRPRGFEAGGRWYRRRLRDPPLEGPGPGGRRPVRAAG